jgi:hypothetical protein
VVAKLMENNLIVRGQEVFQAISANPIIWIDLAYRIQSKVLFKEALIHLTGNYNALKLTPPNEAFVKKYPRARSILDQLTPELRDLVEDKHDELKAICQNVDREVSAHYLPGLQKSTVTGQAKDGSIGRIDYAKDVFSWVSVSLYRHWWGLTLAAVSHFSYPYSTYNFPLTLQQGETYQNKYGGHDMYTRLFNGGKSYLTRDIQSSFHQHFPMSNRAQGVIENNLDIMKAGIVKIVTPLMKNESQLDITKTPVKWLTCIKVKGADYLWDPEIVPEQEPEEEYEEEFEVQAEQETEQSAEEGAVEDPGEEYEVQPVSEKANGKRGVDEDFVETGPSVEPARKKGKGRAMELFEEDNLDADDDDDAEGEEA